MVDEPLLAAKVAAVRDAVARIREVLPPDRAQFVADRTVREVVILNLFVAVQDCLSIATHWLADEGWSVPSGYRDVFVALADHSVVSHELADRMAAAAGLRNLVAHRYGVLDWERVHAIASEDVDDLLEFCAEVAGKARDE